jgi:cardiolipin synthase
VDALVAGQNLWLAAALVVVDVIASAHVVLHKRDSRAATTWLAVIWIIPGIGALAYLLLGLNRIKRRALELREQRSATPMATEHPSARVTPAMVAPIHDGLASLATLAERLSGRPLLSGNAVSPLVNGDEAFPAMITAIDGATRSVAMSSYIFAADTSGRQFIDALQRARARGVAVRVLIDAVGLLYTWPSTVTALRRAGVPVVRFLPLLSATGSAFFNLRNHRKLLIVDGQTAFAGGMNISDRHVAALHPPTMTRDVHFRLEGPIAMQLLCAFAEDWAFAAGEVLDGPKWRTEPPPAGPTLSRTITNGPDEDFEVVRHVLLGALAAARRTITIVTPYFVPDQALITALGVAALRGVRVRIVIPSRGNIFMVRWATWSMLWQVLRPGCEVYLTPAPFDHAKMMVVDSAWTLLGSTNWDARSLRLNFELDVEHYDPAFAAVVETLIDDRLRGARRISLAEADARPLLQRLRDGVARLFTPFL